MARLSPSTSVRLALGYAGLFTVSSAVLVGFLWWRAAGDFGRLADAAIWADAAEIGDQLKDVGMRGAIEAIRVHSAEVGGASAIYLLADRRLKPLAGNLSAWPDQVASKAGWYWIRMRRGAEVDTVRVLRTSLSGGLNLLVGRDLGDRAEIRALVVDTVSWAAVTALVLAIGGGILVRRAVLRRVEMINLAATAIVHGDLTRRLPVREGGDAFDRLARTINLILFQIQQLVESVRNTANIVAHDLRTPLAELRTRFEELSRMRPDGNAVFAEIPKAVADIDRVIGVFNALLRLAEIDSGIRRSEFRAVELAGLATEVAEFYTPLIEEKRGTFVLDAPKGLFVNGDPHLLAQAIGNLVHNAVKYTPRHGAVSLRIVPSAASGIEIVVADNGPGIADAEKPLVTQRFYRCPGTGGEAGIGLGLSIVDAVARLHDGSFSLADNHPGLRAVLRLPAVSAAPELSLQPDWQASPVSSKLGERFGEGFEVAERLSAKRERNTSADQDHDHHRAEEDRRRSGVRSHYERREDSSEYPGERFSEEMPASPQGRRKLLG
jgi:signal transduction histidine kinase